MDLLGANGQVSASLLAKEFTTSEDTIRRDLRDLASRGLCQRVYGGAVLVSPAWTSIQVRTTEERDREDALGNARYSASEGSVHLHRYRHYESKGRSVT